MASVVGGISPSFPFFWPLLVGYWGRYGFLAMVGKTLIHNVHKSSGLLMMIALFVALVLGVWLVSRLLFVVSVPMVSGFPVLSLSMLLALVLPDAALVSLMLMVLVLPDAALVLLVVSLSPLVVLRSMSLRVCVLPVAAP